MLPPLRLQTAWQASTVASSDSQFGSSSVFIVPRDTDLLINWPVDATVAAQASLSIAASSTRPTLSTSFDGDLLMWQQHQPTNGRLLVDSTILSNLTDGASFWLTIGICDRLVQCNYTMQQLQFHESGPVVDRPVAANVLQRSGTYYSASNAITFSWASPTTPFSISSLRWSFCRVEVDVEAMSQLNLTASHSDCPVPLSPLSTNTTSVNQTAALEAGVNYQAFLIACDSLGLCSSTSSAPFVFDVTPPIGWIRFAEADAAASVVYWSDATRFPLSFHVRDQETPWLQSIVVCVGSSPINATDYGCKNVPVNSRSTVLVPADGNLTHFVLRPSRLLYAQVLVTNIIGLSASYISSAVTVDLTAPDTTNAIVRIAGQGDISQIVYRTVTDDLSAAWDAFTDAESHAVSYEVTMCEGSAAAPGPCPLPWLAVGVDTSVEWSALSLSSLSPLTQYAARVRGTNAAMLSVEVWSASRWMRLTNPPVTLPIVTGCINASASPSTAAWLPASQEPKLNLTYRAFSSVVSACFNVSGPQVGGTNSFDWRVCDDSTSCAAEWLSLRLLQTYARINLSFVPQQPLLHGSRGHVEVRSTNVAGLSSISVSTSWLVDQTVPVLPANPRIVTNGLSDGYQSRLNTIAFECESGQDDESGIARYDVAVGTRSEPLLFQQWAPVGCASISMDGHRVILSCNISTPLSLQQLALQQPTIFLITVRAVNRAGLFSSRASQLVTLAPAPPTSASSLISFTGLHRQLFSSDNATEAYAITDLRWGEMSWNLVLANDSTAVAAFDIAFHLEPKYFDSNVVNADAFIPNVLQWQPMGTAQQASFLALNLTLPPLARVFPLVRAIALSGAYVVFSLPQPLIYLPAPPEALAVSLQQPSVNLAAAASVVFTAQWNLSRDTWLRNYLQTLELQLCVVLPNAMAAVGDNCQPTVAITDPIAGTVNLHVDAPMQGAAYRVYVRLSNLAGLSSTSESVVVVYDTTAPTAGPVTIVAQDAAGMWLNSLQRLQLYVSDFSDPESVNLTYKLALTVDDAFPSLSNLLLPWVDVTRAVPNVQLVDRTYVQNQSRALFNSSMVAVNLIDILTQMSTNSTVPTMLSAWVVVTNAANLSVTAHSATVGLDLTAPIQPQNISLNGAILQTAPFGTNRPLISLPFVSISRSLTLNLTGWTAPISGIGTYEICITLVSNLSSVTDQSFSSFSTRALLPCRIVVLPQGQDALTIPALPNTWPDGSVLSLSLSATSNAGLRTQVESKFAVDTTPPLPPLVIDESCIEVGANDTSGGDIDYSSTPSMICASWNAATDSQSGIIAYEFGVFASPIAVGPQTLAPTPSSWVPIVPFTPVFGFRIRRTLSVDMRTGVRYTAAVRVTNSARLSVIAQSDSFVLDVASVAVQSALIQPRPDANNLVAASTGILFSNISRLHSPNSTSSPAPVATNATTTSTNVGAFALAPGDRVNVSLEASIDLGLLPHSCAGVSADECALANTNFQLPANYTESLAKLNLTVVDPKALGGVTEAASYSIAPMVSVAYRLWQHVPIASNSSNANNTDLTKGGSDNSTLIDASSNFQLLSHSPLSRSISSQYSACCDIYDAARVRDQPSLAIIAEQGVMQPTSRSRAQLFNTTYAHSIASKGDYIAVASTEMVQLLYVAGMSPVVAGTWNLPALRSSHSLNPPVPAGGMKPLVVMSDSQLLISNWGMVHHFSLTNGRNFSTSSPPLSFIRHDFLASDTGIRLPPSTLFASAMDLADRYAVFCAPADPVVTETVLYTYSCSGVNNASPNEPCLWKPSQTVATPNSFSSCTGVALSMPLSRLVIASAGSAVNIYSISVVSSTIQTTWIQTVRAAQVGAGSGFAASIALIDAYLAVTTMPALNAIANDSTLVTSAPMVHVFDLSQITGVRSVCNTSTGNLPKSVQNNPTLGAHVSVQLRRAPLTSKQGKQPSSIGYATLMIAVASLNPPSIELFHARLGLNQSDSVCHWSAHFQPADAISAASPSQRVQSVISGERVWMAMPDRVNLGADGNVTSLGSLSFASYCNPWQRLVASNDSSVFPYMCESCPSEYQSRGGVDGTCSACGNSTSQQCYSDGAIVTDVLDDLSILTHGARYFVEINATAASGNWRAINTSSFIYDITPPTTGNLFQLVYTPEFLHLDSETQNQTAQGAQLPQNCLSCGNETLWQSRCDGLALQFTGFKEDATEISYYEWWVGTAPNTNNILKQFLSSFASIAVNGSLTLIPGVPYYSTLFAVNSVGLRSNVTSAGMSCTVTPPYLEFVKDGMQFNVDVSSQSFTDYMFANYHAIDQFAPIGEYYVAFAGERNLNKSFTSKLKWIPASNATMFVSAASLVPGLTWYSYAYALNAAGLKSQILASDGVVIGKAEVVIGDDAATGGQVTNFMIDPVNITHVSTNASTSGLPNGYAAAMVVSVPPQPANHTLRLLGQTLTPNDIQMAATNLSANSSLVGVVQPTVYLPPFPNLHWANYSFTLSALEGNMPVHGYIFSSPINLTLAWDPTPLLLLNPSLANDPGAIARQVPAMTLFDTTQQKWILARDTCAEPQDWFDLPNKLYTVKVCHLTQFAIAYSEAPVAAANLTQPVWVAPSAVWIDGSQSYSPGEGATLARFNWSVQHAEALPGLQTFANCSLPIIYPLPLSPAKYFQPPLSMHAVRETNWTDVVSSIWRAANVSDQSAALTPFLLLVNPSVCNYSVMLEIRNNAFAPATANITFVVVPELDAGDPIMISTDETMVVDIQLHADDWLTSYFPSSSLINDSDDSPFWSWHLASIPNSNDSTSICANEYSILDIVERYNPSTMLRFPVGATCLLEMRWNTSHAYSDVLQSVVAFQRRTVLVTAQRVRSPGPSYLAFVLPISVFVIVLLFFSCCTCWMRDQKQRRQERKHLHRQRNGMTELQIRNTHVSNLYLRMNHYGQSFACLSFWFDGGVEDEPGNIEADSEVHLESRNHEISDNIDNDGTGENSQVQQSEPVLPNMVSDGSGADVLPQPPAEDHENADPVDELNIAPFKRFRPYSLPAVRKKQRELGQQLTLFPSQRWADPVGRHPLNLESHMRLNNGDIQLTPLGMSQAEPVVPIDHSDGNHQNSDSDSPIDSASEDEQASNVAPTVFVRRSEPFVAASSQIGNFESVIPNSGSFVVSRQGHPLANASSSLFQYRDGRKKLPPVRPLRFLQDTDQ